MARQKHMSAWEMASMIEWMHARERARLKRALARATAGKRLPRETLNDLAEAEYDALAATCLGELLNDWKTGRVAQ